MPAPARVVDSTARHERDRGADRAPGREVDAALGARPVDERAVAHERRRPASADVDRGAELEHQARELGQRQAGVVARAPVAGDREDQAAADAERSARVAPAGDVGVELTLPCGEPLRVAAGTNDAAAARDEQRPRLEQVAARLALVKPPLRGCELHRLFTRSARGAGTICAT